MSSFHYYYYDYCCSKMHFSVLFYFNHLAEIVYALEYCVSTHIGRYLHIGTHILISKPFNNMSHSEKWIKKTFFVVIRMYIGTYMPHQCIYFPFSAISFQYSYVDGTTLWLDAHISLFSYSFYFHIFPSMRCC